MSGHKLHNKAGTLVVNEIFHSIKGESSHMGCPCVFVRLTYCNTKYAFFEGKLNAQLGADEKKLQLFDIRMEL